MGYILTNRELTPVAKKDFKFSESIVEFKQKGLPKMYYVRYQMAVLPKELFLGNDCYIVDYEDENENKRPFLLVNDKEGWVYTYHLPRDFDWNVHRYSKKELIQKMFETADIRYKKKKGMEVETTEDQIYKDVIEKIKKESGSEDFTFLDTRHKLKDPCQTIKVSHHYDKKKWNQFFLDIGLCKTVPQAGLRYYPDLIVYNGKINTNKNPTKWIFELEIGMHNIKNFLYKLKKAHTTKCPIYFIFSERSYDWHYNLIEEFMVKKYVKSFNRLYVTTLSEFREKGMASFDCILQRK